MQYKLLVSDFDNTLVPFGEPKPRPAVVKAVKKLQAAGVKFALSTGRAYPCVHREQLGGIRPDYIVTCNGACVTDSKGTVVAEHPLTNEEMYALVDSARITTTHCSSISGMPAMCTVSTRPCATITQRWAAAA